MLLRPRKQLARPVEDITVDKSSTKELFGSRQYSPRPLRTPDAKRRSLFQPDLLSGSAASKAQATKFVNPESMCSVGCMLKDCAHVGLCITADGQGQPPSIKRSHARFKEDGSKAMLSAVLLWRTVEDNELDFPYSPVAKRLLMDDAP